jgi:hypothetical protein
MRCGCAIIRPQPQHLPDAPLFSDHFWGSFVSPDRKLLAYKTVLFEAGELVDNRLVLVDSDGQTIAAMDWEDNWFRIEGWLDMEHLILGSTDYAWPGVYVVNPFTGESQEFTPSLPDFYIDPLEQEKGMVN